MNKRKEIIICTVLFAVTIFVATVSASKIIEKNRLSDLSWYRVHNKAIPVYQVESENQTFDDHEVFFGSVKYSFINEIKSDVDGFVSVDNISNYTRIDDSSTISVSITDTKDKLLHSE